ncbi:hypothetical protein [Nocardiopsis sp. ATB16-24]|uniref:hypothetical protein n=1 Tax=Nocardiopsis sp. ATB16-24 TaxID=3019555 RepID=UPI0025545BBB|nr:hypothetical protein [Nocardiopsis sp. ATB16-24]
MSFQAYLDTIEDEADLVPRLLVDRVEEKGYDASSARTPSSSDPPRTTGWDAVTRWSWSTPTRRGRR